MRMTSGRPRAWSIICPTCLWKPSSAMRAAASGVTVTGMVAVDGVMDSSVDAASRRRRDAVARHQERAGRDRVGRRRVVLFESAADALLQLAAVRVEYQPVAAGDADAERGAQRA